MAYHRGRKFGWATGALKGAWAEMKEQTARGCSCIDRRGHSWKKDASEGERDGESELRTRTGRAVVLHDGAGVNELEGVPRELSVVGDLIAECCEFCVGGGAGKVQSGVATARRRPGRADGEGGEGRGYVSQGGQCKGRAEGSGRTCLSLPHFTVMLMCLCFLFVDPRMRFA